MLVSRAVITTSTGAVQFWQGDVVQWTREESLSEIESVEFVDLPEKEVIASAVQDDESFAGKMLRQTAELQVYSLHQWTCWARELIALYGRISHRSS